MTQYVLDTEEACHRLAALTEQQRHVLAAMLVHLGQGERSEPHLVQVHTWWLTPMVGDSMVEVRAFEIMAVDLGTEGVWAIAVFDVAVDTVVDAEALLGEDTDAAVVVDDNWYCIVVNDPAVDSSRIGY